MPVHDFPRIKLDDLLADFPGVFDTAKYVDVGIGWLGLVRDFVVEALPHDPSPTVHELKEKFGTLRIWSDTEVTAARLAKAKAEIKSSSTCEVCGSPGFLRRPPPGKYAWWRTLCDEHASEDQRSWGTRQQGPMHGYMQVRDDWYRYDEITDAMVPSEPPARWR
ncbi:hypothetical protein [Agrobacterium sp. LAD9]|uniref:hypothetical protein n=1 Tax=Agrobacterium sp. LAD9 TaxID=2055153 RepID=UPI000D1DCFE2|nr:hypothetical protein [Agrobacterium sp. LAD9]